MSKASSRIKTLRLGIVYRIEYLGLLILYFFFKAVSLERASRIGKTMAQWIGPIFLKFKKHDRYFYNDVRAVFPGISDQEIARLSADMWENLGRTLAEMFFWERIWGEKRITVVNDHIFKDAKSRGCIFISGHFANWEILIGVGEFYELSPIWLYQKLRNPYAEKFLKKMRRKMTQNLFMRGEHSLLEILSALRKNQSIGLLIDQRMKTGRAVDFCGRKALTHTLPAYIHLQSGYPIIPVMVERVEEVGFRVTACPPIERGDLVCSDENIEKVTLHLNTILESWIRKNPAQWLWLNDRWRIPSDYKNPRGS